MTDLNKAIQSNRKCIINDLFEYLKKKYPNSPQSVLQEISESVANNTYIDRNDENCQIIADADDYYEKLGSVLY